MKLLIIVFVLPFSSEFPFLGEVRKFQCLSAEVSKQSQLGPNSLVFTKPWEITRQLLGEAKTTIAYTPLLGSSNGMETTRGLSMECVESKTSWSWWLISNIQCNCGSPQKWVFRICVFCVRFLGVFIFLSPLKMRKKSKRGIIF